MCCPYDIAKGHTYYMPESNHLLVKNKYEYSILLSIWLCTFYLKHTTIIDIELKCCTSLMLLRVRIQPINIKSSSIMLEQYYMLNLN